MIFSFIDDDHLCSLARLRCLRKGVPRQLFMCRHLRPPPCFKATASTAGAPVKSSRA